MPSAGAWKPALTLPSSAHPDVLANAENLLNACQAVVRGLGDVQQAADAALLHSNKGSILLEPHDRARHHHACWQRCAVSSEC